MTSVVLPDRTSAFCRVAVVPQCGQIQDISPPRTVENQHRIVETPQDPIWVLGRMNSGGLGRNLKTRREPRHNSLIPIRPSCWGTHWGTPNWAKAELKFMGSPHGQQTPNGIIQDSLRHATVSGCFRPEAEVRSDAGSKTVLHRFLRRRKTPLSRARHHKLPARTEG